MYVVLSVEGISSNSLSWP